MRSRQFMRARLVGRRRSLALCSWGAGASGVLLGAPSCPRSPSPRGLDSVVPYSAISRISRIPAISVYPCSSSRSGDVGARWGTIDGRDPRVSGDPNVANLCAHAPVGPTNKFVSPTTSRQRATPAAAGMLADLMPSAGTCDSGQLRRCASLAVAVLLGARAVAPRRRPRCCSARVAELGARAASGSAATRDLLLRAVTVLLVVPAVAPGVRRRAWTNACT